MFPFHFPRFFPHHFTTQKSASAKPAPGKWPTAEKLEEKAVKIAAAAAAMATLAVCGFLALGST